MEEVEEGSEAVSREDSQGDRPMPLQSIQRHTSIDMGGISKQPPAAPGSGLTRAASVGSPFHAQPRQQRGRTPSTMGESARMGDLCDMQVGWSGYAPVSFPKGCTGLDPPSASGILQTLQVPGVQQWMAGGLHDAALTARAHALQHEAVCPQGGHVRHAAGWR